MSEPNTNPSELLLYQTEDGKTRIQVRLDGPTVWLSQKTLSELFQKDVRTVNEHLQNIYEEGELLPEATIRKFRIVQNEGGRRVERLIDHYNLESVLAVGYRVKSLRGTQFRQWATRILSDFLVKGFVLDDQRLKDGKGLDRDYFDELLERIRDIRSSERRFYQKIEDIFATSVDYDSKSDLTQTFFATVQNKLHWAIHGHTAAEVIRLRADSGKANMGLTNWKNSPSGPVRKADVSVAKNYLKEEELKALNHIVTMYLDYAELQAQNRKAMGMTDWTAKLDAFLEFNEQNVLTHAGRVSAELAKEFAESEFDKFNGARLQKEAENPDSDFDRAIEEVNRLQMPSPLKADS